MKSGERQQPQGAGLPSEGHKLGVVRGKSMISGGLGLLVSRWKRGKSWKRSEEREKSHGGWVGFRELLYGMIRTKAEEITQISQLGEGRDHSTGAQICK